MSSPYKIIDLDAHAEHGIAEHTAEDNLLSGPATPVQNPCRQVQQTSVCTVIPGSGGARGQTADPDSPGFADGTVHGGHGGQEPVYGKNLMSGPGADRGIYV